MYKECESVYKINDAVLYGVNGICTITGVEEKTIDKEIKSYYVLKPVYNKASTLYVPVDSEILISKMRKLLTEEEVYELIDDIKDEEPIWIENEQERNKKYNEILKSGDRRAIMKMIKALYEHRQRIKNTGKKFHVADEKIMRAAESILHEEFAYVLDMKRENVIAFIVEKMSI